MKYLKEHVDAVHVDFSKDDDQRIQKAFEAVGEYRDLATQSRLQRCVLPTALSLAPNNSRTSCNNQCRWLGLVASITFTSISMPRWRVSWSCSESWVSVKVSSQRVPHSHTSEIEIVSLEALSCGNLVVSPCFERSGRWQSTVITVIDLSNLIRVNMGTTVKNKDLLIV